MITKIAIGLLGLVGLITLLLVWVNTPEKKGVDEWWS